MASSAQHPSVAMEKPQVSVIMAVYNGARYLRQAVDSILTQTFVNFEFVIVDDGSSDETFEILASYDDPRVVLLQNTHNIGLTKSLNRGIIASGGEFIARQDADDASLAARLSQQVAYLKSHPEVGLVGCGSRWIDGQDEYIRDWSPQTELAQIQQLLLASVPLLHGTFLFRRHVLGDVGGGYDEVMPLAQDCDLLFKISERWELANLPEILYIHRIHEGTVTSKRKVEQESCLRLARNNAIERRLTYGRARLGVSKSEVPDWVHLASRGWLAQRYVWWSASARMLDRQLALKFLLIALLLDPTAPDLWHYLYGIFARKIGMVGG